MPTATAVTFESLVAEYRARNAGSHDLFRRAQSVLPGGNTRTGVFVDPFPVYIDHAQGVELVDVDGNRRLDFVNNASALILGHAHPAVVEAIAGHAGRGSAYFAPCPLELELAELLARRIPSLERLRFCSSGTEAGRSSSTGISSGAGAATAPGAAGTSAVGVVSVMFHQPRSRPGRRRAPGHPASHRRWGHG